MKSGVWSKPGISPLIDSPHECAIISIAVFLAGENEELLPQVQTLAFDEKINLPLTIAAAPSDGSACPPKRSVIFGKH